MLLIVLVVVVLLALGAYTFSETMISEYEASTMYGREVQTRALADSGVEYAATVLGRQAEMPYETFYDRPDLFRGVIVRPSDRSRGRGRFSIVTSVESDVQARSLRFGFVNESAKLNLNTISVWQRDDKLDDDQSRNFLLHLPGMSYEIADAILDWLDDDELPRRYGAESEYYQRLDSPYFAGNGPLQSLDELLLVRGATPGLLYGEDLNCNGLLEPGEDDGDGVLRRGWETRLTLFSREANRRSDGRPKINLNQPSIDKLIDEVSNEFGDDVAAFIAAVRLESQDEAAAVQPDANQIDPDVPIEGKSRIKSVYDLIDVEVAASESNGPAMRSPFSSDSSRLKQYLPRLLDVLSPHGRPFIAGRVNINTAPREVLLGIPGMTESLADAIVARQARLSTGEPSAAVLASHATTAWLLLEELVDLAQMRQLDRYITGRGDVYRVQSLGYYDAGGPFTRLESVIDASVRPPKVVLLRDLTEFGRGYHFPIADE